MQSGEASKREEENYLKAGRIRKKLFAEAVKKDRIVAAPLIPARAISKHYGPG